MRGAVGLGDAVGVDLQQQQVQVFGILVPLPHLGILEGLRGFGHQGLRNWQHRAFCRAHDKAKDEQCDKTANLPGQLNV